MADRPAVSLGALALAVGLAGAPRLCAQITVRQGTVADLPSNEVQSPMLMELPFEGFGTFKDGETKAFYDQAKYICDDVILDSIVIKEKIREKGSIVRLVMAISITVRPGYDR